MEKLTPSDTRLILTIAAVIWIPVLLLICLMQYDFHEQVVCGTRGCGPYHEWKNPDGSKMRLVGSGGVYSLSYEFPDSDTLVLMEFLPFRRDKDALEMQKETFAKAWLPHFYRVTDIWGRK